MKSITSYLVLGLMVISLTSCDNFLDVKPQGTITQDNVGDADNIDGLIIAAYAWVPHEATINQKISPWLADIKSDDSYKGGGGLSDQTPWYQMEVFSLVTADVGNNDGMWYGSYQGISRCNTALRALNDIDESDYPLKTQRIAEMRFIRGWMYAQLKKNYKWIPYFREDATSEEIKLISNHPDSVQNDLYLWNDIYEDFKFAAENLPETQEDKGRPSKYAAEAEAANTLMWMAYEENDQNQVVNINKGRLTDALQYINDIIDSGKYSLSQDFAHNFMFSYDNATPESIWEWQYTHDDGTPNGNLNGGTPLNAPWWPPHFSCCDFHKPSYTMVNAFKVNADGLPLFSSYNDQEINDKQSYFSTNTWDARMGHTVAVPGLPWKYQTDLVFDSSASRNPAIYGYFSSLKENVRADSPGLVDLFWMWNSKNVTAIRYDRVLLWKAEILIQLNRETEALPIINKIRQRASNSTSDLKFADGSSTLNYEVGQYQPGVNCTWDHDFAWKALVWENRLEFAMEGERWYDIVRWGIADSVMNAYFTKESQRGRSWLKDGHFVSGRDEYLPIPQPQMNWARGNYKQNPGY